LSMIFDVEENAVVKEDIESDDTCIDGDYIIIKNDDIKIVDDSENQYDDKFDRNDFVAGTKSDVREERNLKPKKWYKRAWSAIVKKITCLNPKVQD
jgi:hypothetical protein